MRIIDVYGSNNGIVLVETSNKLYGIEVETIHRKFTGQNANIYLERLSRLIPEKIYDNGTDAKLNFNKPIVLILHDYKNINLKDIKPIAELLKSKNISLKFHNYKLQKSNNFYGKILIPMTLVTIISLSTPYIVKQIIKKKDKMDTNNTEVIYDLPIDNIDEEETTSTLYLSGINYSDDTGSLEFIDNEDNFTTEIQTETTTMPNDEIQELSENTNSNLDDSSSTYIDIGNDAEDTVYNYLKTETNFNDAAIAGIMGNIEQECSFDIETIYQEANGYISHGLCQWNGERYENLKRFCGNNLHSIELQLSFMINELKNSYTYVYNTLLNIDDSVDGAMRAALIFAQRYEVCDSGTYDDRQYYAKGYYNIISNSDEYNNNKSR